MASTKVHLPDGSEENASDVICEDCDKPVSQHSCVNGAGSSGGSGAATVSRSTGPRKDPRARPQCPHCGGAVHFSMPGGLQNVECIMRQYFIDRGVIVDAYATLPLYGIDELSTAVTWAKDLKSPITYGRMDSAAGGAGTYAALRPKASTDKATTGTRPRKQKAAAAGEKIEDLAASVVTPTVPAPAGDAANGVAKRKPGRPKKVTITGAQPASTQARDQNQEQDSAPVSMASQQAEADERRAKRRALLGIGR